MRPEDIDEAARLIAAADRDQLVDGGFHGMKEEAAECVALKRGTAHQTALGTRDGGERRAAPHGRAPSRGRRWA